jgi:hypothetical protein
MPFLGSLLIHVFSVLIALSVPQAPSLQKPAVPPRDSEVAMALSAAPSGRFISPRRPGVAYMLSGDIKHVNRKTGGVSSFPPHVMFYAPNLTNADIGSKGDGSDGMPFIAYQGPHGFMIMMPSMATGGGRP